MKQSKNGKVLDQREYALIKTIENTLTKEEQGVFCAVLEYMQEGGNDYISADYSAIGRIIGISNAEIKRVVECCGIFEIRKNGGKKFIFAKNEFSPLIKEKEIPPKNIYLNTPLRKRKLTPFCFLSSSIEDDMSETAEKAQICDLSSEKIRNDKKDVYQEIIDFWNERTRNTRLNNIRNNRKTLTDVRLKENGKEDFFKAMQKALESDFLTNSTFFSYDWLIKPNNFDKIISGNYDNREERTQTTRPTRNQSFGFGGNQTKTFTDEDAEHFNGF